MKWHRDFYVGKTLQKNRKKMKRQIEADKPIPGLYLICVCPDAEKNQLEIIPQYFLKRDYREKDSLLVVGIAVGQSEMKELLLQMTDRVYRETGTADLRTYFLSH